MLGGCEFGAGIATKEGVTVDLVQERGGGLYWSNLLYMYVRSTHRHSIDDVVNVFF